MSISQLIRAAFGRKPVAGKSRGNFRELQELYLRRLERWPVKRGEKCSGPKVGVVITPWLFTPVPFFSLECAQVLSARGAEVVLLWDASNVFLNAAKQSEVATVHEVLAPFAGKLRTLDVAAFTPAAEVRHEFVEGLLYENAVRQMRGEGAAREFLRTHPECIREMQTHAARLQTMLVAERFDWLLVPGGVWAASGLYMQVACDLGLSISTYDSGESALYVAHEGPAAHFSDISASFHSAAAVASEADRQRMMQLAWAQLDDRRHGRDTYRLQPVTSAGLEPFDLVVPLNYRSDTAALFRQRLFASVTDWLQQLLEWVGTQPRIRVAIRQHPCERIPEFRGSDAWREVLAPYSALGDRLHFVAAEDPINSYDLIDTASVVLPYTSRIGIEAAMMGKAVIMNTHCYYQDCGFVQNPVSSADYFAQIGRAVAGGLIPDKAAREAAAMVYYFAECCLPVSTKFTPQAPDFRSWAEEAPETLWHTPEVDDLMTALLSREPLALLRHRRRLQEEALPSLPISP